MSDLLFRGRGADVGGRAPAWRVRMAGALLGLAFAQLASTLDLWDTAGVSITTARVGAIALGALLATGPFGAWLWGVNLALGALLLTVSHTPLVAPLASAFVRRDPDVAPPPDAVVVLSGSVTDDGLVNGPALERLLTGMAEAKRRGIPELALSVVGDDADPTVPLSEGDQRQLVTDFASEVHLRLVHDVHSTRDEALAFAALARTQGWKRVLLVTSPLHTRRACAVMERTGLTVQCLPAVPRMYSVTRLDRPESRRLAFADLVYETAATALYRLNGWL